MVSRLIPVLASLVLAACGSVPVHERHDLSTMRPDCTNAGLQIKWIEAQLRQGKFDPKNSEYERKYVAQAQELIWTIRTTCMRNAPLR